MKIKNLSLPNPVLGKNDDVEGAYRVEFLFELGREEIKVSLNHDLSNKTLLEKIEKKQVIYTTEVICTKTDFRKTFKSLNANQAIVLSTSELRDRVDLQFFITSEEEMPDYKIEGSNPDYGNETFLINKGDVLAYGGETFFIAAKGYALMTVSSFMIIVSSEIEEGPMYIDLSDDEKVIIKLSKKDFEKYNYCKAHGYKDVYPIFHASIAFPALLHILYSMHGNSDEHEGKSWYENLNWRIKNQKSFVDENLDISNTNEIPKIAQLLLGLPINRSFDSVGGIVERIEGD